MKYLFLFFTCLSAAIAHGQSSNTRSIKWWSATDTLNWGDFKGLDDGSSYAAWISWEIRVHVPDTTHIEIAACIDTKRSWWRIPGRHLLRHEQYHFNIAEIFARLIRKTVTEKKLYPATGAFTASFDALLAQCREMEKQYDLTTKHSQDEAAQATWETYIDKQLHKLEAWQAPVIPW